MQREQHAELKVYVHSRYGADAEKVRLLRNHKRELIVLKIEMYVQLR